MIPPTLEQATLASAQAHASLNQLTTEIYREKQRAEQEVIDRHAADLAARRAIAAACERDLRAAKDRELPAHEWEGKKVWHVARRGSAWNRIEVRVEGVVETMRTTTRLPNNTPSWREPPLGYPFVRLLKADGTPGTKFMSFNQDYQQWKLVAGQD